jgi:hypothetical protein
MTDLNQKLIVALVLIPVLLGIFRTTTEMWLSIVALGLALMFANIDRITRFRAPGFEADLQAVVTKAYAAIDELKELGLSLSAPIVDELAVSGRMLQYLPLRAKLERVQKIADTLKALGASQIEIDKATATIYERVTRDHLDRIKGALTKSNAGKDAALNELSSDAAEEWDTATFKKYIADNGLERNDVADEWIADLEYFRTNHKLRRPTEWQS